MRLCKYSEYRDSGIDWIGEIPKHWEVKRLGSKFLERKEKVSDKEYQALSVTKKGILKQLDNVAKTNDNDNRKLVKNGDFVINSRSDRKGSSGLSSFDGSVSLINIVLKPLNIDENFSNYLFKSNNFVEEFYKNGHGIVADLWTTRYWDMKIILIPIPSLKEQKKIAFFLDKKIANIDKFIENREKVIELLKEKKQIIINRAVTKGIDKNIELKDSGVDWIGEIPKHWEVRKLKYILKLESNKVIISNNKKIIALENIESGTGEFIKTNSKYQGEGILFNKDNILFGKLRPYLAKVYFCKKQGIAFGDLLVYKAINIFPKFGFYLMLSNSFIVIINSSTYGAKMPRVSPNFINNLLVPLPPPKEQKKIVEYIENQTKKIDKAINLQKEYIQKLKEYKEVLINEVVTGKVRVCDENS
ncbi:MAG: restriction endonuclease subunit S [Epsilonproteobacteria bacterium]|nr:restriction endonuclease subunit S [Campylobacterota bacterium]